MLPSPHLTRVHDGESLEDLKPWRVRAHRRRVSRHRLFYAALVSFVLRYCRTGDGDLTITQSSGPL